VLANRSVSQIGCQSIADKFKNFSLEIDYSLSLRERGENH
jgi:hypothetical protein